MYQRAVSLCCTNHLRRQTEDFVRQISKSASAPNSGTITSRTQERTQDEKQNKKLFKSRKNHRYLSTVPLKEERLEFMSIFPDIVRDLTNAERYLDITEITKWYTKILQYNVPNRKKTRGLTTVMSYKLLEDPQRLTTENIRLANIMGWCIELHEAFFLVADDIMDNSEARQGIPCWYKHSDVGKTAFNDSILLENGTYFILRRYLRDHPCYIPVIELFHDITLKTSMGQALDMLTARQGKPNLDLFTMDRYNSIAKYKTSYYSFHLPVALSMYMAGIYDEELHRQSKTILLEMGHFCQVQDDFIDCFDNPEVTGKMSGNDISEGKCTWLSVVALQRASPAQREVFKKHYGCPTETSVQAVVDIYEELGIPDTYAIYKEETYNRIHTHIQQMSDRLPHKLFIKVLELIYLIPF